MKPKAVTLAVTLVAAVNAVVLAGVWYNRTGSPDATVVLTERELPVAAYRGPWSKEDTGLELRIRWHRPRPGNDWLDRAKLEAMGFDAKQMDAWENAKTRPRAKQLASRQVFVVLEYDGPAWSAYLKRRERQLARLEAKVRKGAEPERKLKAGREALKRLRRGGSRLFAVDAGANAAALRRHYPDTRHYLIVPAVVRAVYGWSNKDKQGQVSGYIRRLLPATLHVSAAQARRLPEESKSQRSWGYYYGGAGGLDRAPLYEVTLHYGRRHEGWFGAIRPLHGQGQDTDAAPDSSGGRAR